MSKIDEKTSVPLNVVMTGFSVALGVAVAGTFWVASVNARLARIEDKLGIAPYTTETGLIRKALAEPKSTLTYQGHL